MAAALCQGCTSDDQDSDNATESSGAGGVAGASGSARPEGGSGQAGIRGEAGHPSQAGNAGQAGGVSQIAGGTGWGGDAGQPGSAGRSSAGGRAGEGGAGGGAGESRAGEGGDGGVAGESRAGEGGDGGSAGAALPPWDRDAAGPLLIAGDYEDEWQTIHRITDTTWTQVSEQWGTSLWHIARYDNDLRSVIAQNASDNDFFADLWSRFDWTTFDGALWYCQIAYDADSETAALATPRPDDTDPTADGSCGVGTWSALNPRGAGGAGGAGGEAGGSGEGGAAGGESGGGGGAAG